MIKYTHYTTMGATMAPTVADPEGFIAWRDDFQSLSPATWTRGERWIDVVLFEMLSGTRAFEGEETRP